MKITRVEPILVRTPLKLDDAKPHAGGQPKNDVHTVLVKVETDEGVTGWGEAFSNAGWQSTCTAVAQIIAPRVMGRDPSQIAQIQADLHRGLYNTGRSGPTVFAISGLDIALWDIAAKRAGLPLYKMLGGSARETPIERYYCDFTETPFGDQIIPKNGEFAVPQGAGLGQNPDLNLVERMRVA